MKQAIKIKNGKVWFSFIVVIATLFASGWFVITSLWLLDRATFHGVEQAFGGDCSSESCKSREQLIVDKKRRLEWENRISAVVAGGGFLYSIIKRPDKSQVIELP